MITKLLLVLKKCSLFIVVAYVAALTSASLIKLEDIPSLGSSFDDKIYHLLAYFIFMLTVFNFFISRAYNYSLSISAIISVSYGMIIEVLQYTLTSYRSFDLYDALANTCGVFIAFFVLKYFMRTKVKIN